jgi:uncharacterized membrane protein (DUF485 family)
MNDLNTKILQAMNDTDRANTKLDEENADALDLIKQSFHGKFRLTFIFVTLLQLVFAGIAAYAAYQLLNVSDVGSKIEWAVAVIAFVTAFAIARVYFFLELNRLSVLREVKRVELQMAAIAEYIIKE